MTAPDLGALTAKLFASAESGDWQLFRSMFAADAVLWQNISRAQPIDDAMPELRSFTDRGLRLRYDNVRRLVGSHHVTELHDIVFSRPDGDEVVIPACVVVQFNSDGLVERADEYLDASTAAALATL